MGVTRDRPEPRTILLDWAQFGMAAPACDLAWYLAVNSTRLPVSTQSTLQGGDLALQGVERTVSTASRQLTDGAVEDASSTTGGTYNVTLSPGGQGTPVTGTLTIEVRSTTKRLR